MTTDTVRTVHDIPGPTGSFQEIFADLVGRPLDAQMSWWHIYGEIVKIQTPSGQLVFLNHPDLVHQLVTQHLDHGEMSRRTIPAQGRGITVQHGDEWRRSRVLMNPMFGRPQLRRLVGRMVEAIDERLDRLDEVADTGRVINLSQFLGDVTIRILFHAMFSDEYSDDEIDFAVQQLDMIAVYKAELQTSAWRPPDLPLEHEERGRAAVQAMDEVLYRSIRRRRKTGGNDEDLLGRLLAARGEDGDQFDDEEIRDQLTVLFFGGRETTQWATAWALSLLADDPDALARLVAEIDTVVGDRLPTEDDLEPLQYTRAVINEALRHQGALMLPRQLEVDDVFAGYAIPAGTQVVASTMVLHRRPDLWDEPDAFRPERFLGQSAREQHKYQMLSFGGGPRQCLGINLAYFEAQLMLAMLLRRFTYEVDPTWTRRPVHQYSIVLDGGLPARISRRTVT